MNGRTGKIVWKSGATNGDSVLVGNVVIANTAQGFDGRDVASGRLLWRVPLGESKSQDFGRANLIAIGDEVMCSFSEDGREPPGVVDFTKAGREKWRRLKPFNGWPEYADNAWLVTIDIDRILGYSAGTLPPLPASDEGKRDLAEKLAAHYETLDSAEREQLASLAPYAFRPSLARYVEWGKALGVKRADDLKNYGLFRSVESILYSTARPEDTPAIIAAADQFDPGHPSHLFFAALLRKQGNSQEFVPELIDGLHHLPANLRGDSEALEAVARSDRPEAVAFLEEALKDPHAAPAWRRAAFQHLAGTGGSAGLEAVRSARPASRPRLPWNEIIDPSKLAKGDVLGVKTDAKKRTWLLFRSEVLGNRGDLFVVQKLGPKWGRPLFTGAWTGGVSRRQRSQEFRGIPMEKLVAADWIRIFPDDASIRRDSDGDGLTDVVEARLGTNPHKADTDGDGLRDDVDPCPDAAPRSLDDTGKIIAASLEARFFEEKVGVPALMEVENVKPFELNGYSSVALWPQAGKEDQWSKVYGNGVNAVGFLDPDSRPDRNSNQTRFVKFSPDGKSAKTVIVRVSSFSDRDEFEVTLRKIGADWFVTDMQQR